MQSTIDIILDKHDRVYRPGDMVTGVVVVNTRRPLEHQGMVLIVDGSVSMQLSAKSVGLFEAFYSPAKPISILSKTIELQAPPKFSEGKTEVKFEFELSTPGANFYDTYHGVFINIVYTISVEMARSMLAQNLKKSLEFILENRNAGKAGKQDEVMFDITPKSITNVEEVDMSSLPSFRVRGKMHYLNCCISKPFTGELVIENADSPIRSIDLQLVRVESCGYSEGMAKEATEIQTIQLVAGDIGENWTIPIYMLFPRLFTCPTISLKQFKIEFEVNLVINFEQGHIVTETFPITLWRED
eukprot:c40095_g1_i1.p1 GENE.c40095_g1_i1~~c40095_g1_i1.p1  ORF type:complete len:300 (+),score=83.01 c40095_g1_i1:53-952(+)